MTVSAPWRACLAGTKVGPSVRKPIALRGIVMRTLTAACLAVCLLMSAACNATAAADKSVQGDWTYASAVLVEGAKEYKSNVSGGLKLTADGKFEQSRRIGGILNPGKGTYAVKGDQITLTYADGSKTDKYTFIVGDHTDSEGTKFKALTLTSKSDDGSSFKYLLTKPK